MSKKRFFSVAFLTTILFCSTGWAAKNSPQIKLNFTPASQTAYKVVMESGKDYAFIQPSVNKTKERHTFGRLEMVFTQTIESVDKKGTAQASITIDQFKYTTQGQKDDSAAQIFDSNSEKAKSDPMYALIGKSYKISIDPNGSVAVIDAQAVRGAVSAGFAKKLSDKLFTNEEIQLRHQILALMDANKAGKKANKMASKKGDSWMSVAASPQGMLKPKTFEKTYTVTGMKRQGKETIVTIDMKAVPSSKRVEGTPKEDAGMGFLSSMFDEKNDYAGKLIMNLSTGQIVSYQEKLKSEWFAAEPSEDQKSDKGPDQLTMGFTSLYSIEKVK